MNLPPPPPSCNSSSSYPTIPPSYHSSSLFYHRSASSLLPFLLHALLPFILTLTTPHSFPPTTFPPPPSPHSSSLPPFLPLAIPPRVSGHAIILDGELAAGGERGGGLAQIHGHGLSPGETTRHPSEPRTSRGRTFTPKTRTYILSTSTCELARSPA